jgi:GT2 family glycosyltransferase
VHKDFGDDRVTVIVASVGRPDELARWAEHVANQTVKPVEMIWVVAQPADLPATIPACADTALSIVHSPIGSAVQRNVGLDSVRGDPTIIAFFDDDYVPSRTCIEDVIRTFHALPDAVGLTGTLVADGINGPGIDYPTTCALLACHEAERAGRPAQPSFEYWDGLYGCNMAFRAADIGAERFDERLPLYGWQEDVDFAMRVARGRNIGRTDGFHGVHQGVKRGRTSGRRFGYSQIVNPAYLYRKGSMSRKKMLTLAGRNFLANHLRALRPEPWVDRRGRIIGNWLALYDLVRGRVEPERVLAL